MDTPGVYMCVGVVEVKMFIGYYGTDCMESQNLGYIPQSTHGSTRSGLRRLTILGNVSFLLISFTPSFLKPLRQFSFDNVDIDFNRKCIYSTLQSTPRLPSLQRSLFSLSLPLAGSLACPCRCDAYG